MTNTRFLITGASGEIGSELILQLLESEENEVLAVDLRDSLHPSLLSELEERGGSERLRFESCDLTRSGAITQLLSSFQPGTIFHLAAMLSSDVERNPERSFDINLEVPRRFMEAIVAHSKDEAIKLIFPSSIAAYGLSGAEGADTAVVSELDFPEPSSLYGIQKRFIEQLGSYFATRFAVQLDFRCLRFPGLLSAETLPTGGTSDYASEMIHSAAKGEHYSCFSKPESRLPFMVMSDAVRAILELSSAERAKLSRCSYNVNGFSFSSAELETELRKRFPELSVSYEPNLSRVKIIEGWPRQVSDAQAAKDWGFKAEYDFQRALDDYLIPSAMGRYGRLNTENKEQHSWS